MRTQKPRAYNVAAIAAIAMLLFAVHEVGAAPRKPARSSAGTHRSVQKKGERRPSVKAPAKVRTTRARVATRPAVQTHVVRAHETIGGVAQRYGVSVASLTKTNGLRPGHARVKIGQRLIIPLAPSAGPRPPRNFVLAPPGFEEDAPTFFRPVEGPVSSQFGRRRRGWHRGVDIAAHAGEPVRAAAAGVVRMSGVEYRYGRVVKIDHPGGYSTVYAHHSVNTVDAGDEVEAGQIVGRVGRSGNASGHHLHFEIRRHGVVYNPKFLLAGPPPTDVRVVRDPSAPTQVAAMPSPDGEVAVEPEDDEDGETAEDHDPGKEESP